MHTTVIRLVCGHINTLVGGQGIYVSIVYCEFRKCQHSEHSVSLSAISPRCSRVDRVARLLSAGFAGHQVSPEIDAAVQLGAPFRLPSFGTGSSPAARHIHCRTERPHRNSQTLSSGSITASLLDDLAPCGYSNSGSCGDALFAREFAVWLLGRRCAHP